MHRLSRGRSGESLVGAVLCLAIAPAAVAQWPQWGGPKRNFKVEVRGLAEKWPEDGPRKLWYRELGDGYAGIVGDGDVLYTMYRKDRRSADEYTVALDAKTGRTIWEHQNRSPLMSEDDSGWGGQGPNATPLVVGERLFTVGSTSMLRCFEKRTGKVLWEEDLRVTLRAPVNQHVGYAPSPIAYQDTIILAVGRERSETSATPIRPDKSTEGQALVAFRQDTGSVVWKALDFAVRESSPILIRFEGEDQLVCGTAEGLIGVDPSNGRLLWRHPEMGSIVTPVWNGAELLFYTSGGDDAVGRVVTLTKEGDRTAPHELWANRKVRIWQPTPVQIDDYLYGSTSELLLGVNMRTGKRAWAKRGFPMASCIHADGKLIVLDQDGQLSLTTATSDGLTVHSKCKITERYSFTVPTLIGKTLYVRDRKHIMALDLG